MVMTYAITLCFDKASESTLDQARWSAQKALGLVSSKSDAFASHITFGIFENLHLEKLTEDINNKSASAN